MRSSALVMGILAIAFGDLASAQTSPDQASAAAVAPESTAVSSDLPPPPTALAADNAMPAPVYSRVASFNIPFSVSQPDRQTLEVLLFVSHDGGANWVLYNRQPAAMGNFAFRTHLDGEYWFASRTHPVGTVVSAGATFRPELRVIVDTVEPRLDVQATVSPDGEIQVEWQAVDDHLAPETLRIEYQEALGRPYRTVAAPAGQQTAPNRLAGRASWKPEPDNYFVSIRLQVQDRAENSAEVIRRLILPVTRTTRPAAPSPSAALEAGVPADPMAGYGMMKPPASEPPRAPGAEQEVQRPVTPEVPQATAWPSDASQSPEASAGESVPVQSPSPRPVEVREVASSGAGLVEGAPRRQDEQNEAPPPTPSESAARTQATVLPTGERPRMTSSKRFNLDYSVDAVGPAGVEKVELWVTRNGGLDWDLGWLDEDGESPLLVEVEDEGIYGFRLVIVGKNGLASQTPRPGELADLWIGVDTTKPTVEITSAAYGSGDRAGQLDIRWAAADEHLANRPITLSFSEQPDGPWTTIAAGLPNSGQYHWRVDSRVPAQFYLRIEARDEAGNVAVYRLDQPLQSAGLSPKASIRGFAPAGQ